MRSTPPLAKRRADLHVPPPWFQSESRDCSGSKPCTPLLVSKQRVEPSSSCVLPPWPNGEQICMYPSLGSNQRAEFGPALSRVPPSWFPSRELSRPSCVPSCWLPTELKSPFFSKSPPN